MNIKKAMNDFSVDLQIISDFMAFYYFPDYTFQIRHIYFSYSYAPKCFLTALSVPKVPTLEQ